jgi:hypothetical protein
VAISNALILLYKIAALCLLPWIPKALAMLVGQALACMQKMQRSGVQEHFSVAMTVIYELIRGSLDKNSKHET